MRTLIAIALLFSVASSSAAQHADNVAEITMHRGCWGLCRRYSLILTRTGWATCEELNASFKLDRSRAAIDSATFRRLGQFLADGGFFALDTAYVMPGNDMLRTTLCVRGAAFTRCVKHDLFTGPSALRAMEDSVDSVAAHLTWAPPRAR
jgi:hypothetical protein